MIQDFGTSLQDELLLQSYLDGELEPAGVRIVESRLQAEPRLASAERAMREMFGDIVAGFVEIDGNAHVSQVGSLRAAKPRLRKRHDKTPKNASDATRFSLTIVEGTETSREVSVVEGVTVEVKTYNARGRRVILEVATTESSDRIDEWLSSPFVLPPGMSSRVRRVTDTMAVRLYGEMPPEMLDGLTLKSV